MANQDGCSMQASTPFDMMVADREQLSCPGKCANVHLTMQGYHIDTNLYLLPLVGGDIVLGAQWLHTLGPITLDFS